MRSHKNIAVGLVCLSIAACAASSQTQTQATVSALPNEKTISIKKANSTPLARTETVKGLTVEDHNSSAGAKGSPIHVSSPETLASKVNPWVAEQRKKIPQSSGNKSLTMSSGVCGSAGTITCFAVDSTWQSNGKKQVTTQAWYLDTSDNTVTQSQDLVTEDGKKEVNAALKKATPATPDPVDAESLRSASFDTSGALVLRVPNAKSTGFDSYRVEANETESLLTETGKKLRSTIMSGARPTPLPTPRIQKIPKTNVDCKVSACVALTFDDGPGDQTDRLLSILREKGVRATFFTIGEKVTARPDLVKKEAAEGHSVSNHSWDHPQLTRLTPEALQAQLGNTSDAIAQAGAPKPVLMRPPYGSSNDAVLNAIGRNGMAEVRWDVDTEDWKNKNANTITQRALAGTHSGSIVLMHDIHATTIDAVPGLIDQLRARGYTLVTVPQLMGDDMTPYIGRRIFSQHNVR